MKKYYILFVASLSLTLFSCASLLKTAVAPSTWETISAIKEVLNSSTFKALAKLKNLNNTENLPPEVNTVLAGMSALGYGDKINEVKAVVAKASGIALTESEGIFKDAIKEVDLGDAVAIVTGGKDAASQVLKNAMKIAVKKRYSARLATELDKTEANKYWPLAANAYNLFSNKKVDTSLSDFLAERAVDGVFLAMGHEEQEIRKDPASLGIGVVTKVFDYYMKNKGTKS
jgi:hypothetical protein